MSKLLQAIKIDFNFVKSHSLQPDWYKVVKVVSLLGFLVGYYFFFGLLGTIVCFVTFIVLSTIVHMVYRVKTDTWKKSWLDFEVVYENGEPRAESIGKYYYSAVFINALLSIVLSQVVLVLVG